MKLVDIAKLYADPAAYAGQEISVGGWIRTIRDSKAFGFIELNDGTAFRPLQVVLEAEKSGAETVLLSPDVFSKITEERAPDGIIAVVRNLKNLHKELSPSDIPALAASGKRIMAFESLRDPGNLGTVIRSASAFGVDTLILSADCADIYNPKTLRGAMGAIFSREIFFCRELPETLARFSCEGRRVLAATLENEAVAVGKAALTERDIILIGNEGHGLSRSAIAASDLSVILPIDTGRGVESLNAATAASVFMWEQRRISGK